MTQKYFIKTKELFGTLISISAGTLHQNHPGEPGTP